MSNPDRIPDLLLRLAANLAANGIVAVAHTANLVGRRTRPAVKAAAVVGDRLLGSPVPQRDYERMLLDAEEAHEVLAPGWLPDTIHALSDSFWCFEHGCVVARCPDGCDTRVKRLADLSSGRGGGNAVGYGAESSSGTRLWSGPQDQMTSAPGHSPEPVEAESPSAVVSPAAAEGSQLVKLYRELQEAQEAVFAGDTAAHVRVMNAQRRIHRFDQDRRRTQADREAAERLARNPETVRLLEDAESRINEAAELKVEQPASAGVAGPGTGEVIGRAEHPLYRQIQEQADAAVVAEVLAEHHYRLSGARCYCGADNGGEMDPYDWRQHVAPIVIAALQE